MLDVAWNTCDAYGSGLRFPSAYMKAFLFVLPCYDNAGAQSYGNKVNTSVQSSVLQLYQSEGLAQLSAGGHNDHSLFILYFQSSQ